MLFGRNGVILKYDYRNSGTGLDVTKRVGDSSGITTPTSYLIRI